MSATSTIACMHPESGRIMQIDRRLYQPIADAIISVLQNDAALTYTELVRQVKQYIKTNHIDFSGNISWYTVTVRNHLITTGQVQVMTKGKMKLNSLT